MEPFGNRMGGSATPHEQETVKFDASQYEFFGKNVVEHELGEFDESIEYAPSEEAEYEETLSSGKQKCKHRASILCLSDDDLAFSFTKLNRICKPVRARDITERVSSSKESFSKSGSEVPLRHRRLAGVIKWYNNKRGYGFISPNDGGMELYVHNSVLKSDGIIHLWPGTSVEYESIASSDGRMQAINVTASGGRLLQDSRKVALEELSTTTQTNILGSSQSFSSTRIASHRGLGPCFSCGQWGHLAKNCGILAQRCAQSSTQLNWTVADTRNQLESGGGSGFSWCNYCENIGHEANTCPHI